MVTAATEFSAVVITFNEESRIGACLDALRHVTNDIVVADSHSTDRTPELARAAGARLLPVDWQGYARTKNTANAEARHDWILSIDADEVLSPDLINTLQQWSPEVNTVFALDRLTNYCGKWIHHSGWYPEWKPRLFPRAKVFWEGDFLHETLHIPDGFRTARLKGKLLHYSYNSEEDHLKRIEKYARLWAEEQLAAGRTLSNLKRWFGPAARYFITYVLKQGWRDGHSGHLISYYESLMVKRRHEIFDALTKKASDRA